MPALVARPGATSPVVNKVKLRKESLLGCENVRRDGKESNGNKDYGGRENGKHQHNINNNGNINSNNNGNINSNNNGNINSNNNGNINSNNNADTETRTTSRSLALLKERVSRLGGAAGGTGIGDGFQATPREQVETPASKLQPTQRSSHPAPRLVRQASQNAAKSRGLLTQCKDLPERQENEASPFGVARAGGIYSPQVLGAYNWVKEVEALSRQEEAALLLESPKPHLNVVTPDITLNRRLSLSMSLQSGLKGRQALGEELETVSDGGAGVGTRIMVYVRLRPMARKEKDAGSRSCVRIVNKRDVYLTEFALETDYLRLKRVRGRHFAFDASFSDNTSQQEVYNTSTAELVEGVLQGRNGSVFCYGATGAGKTHTMLGTVQNPGVMVLALKDLFAKIKQRSRDGRHVVRLSYLEVYNESVRDLLSPGRPLVLREDAKQGIVAAGLTQYQAYSADEVMTLLQRGNLNRTTEPTRANETSSRSHAILQVVAEYKVQQETCTVVRAGKLSLIDLAGSERALVTDQRSLRSVEGASINRSLLALSSCINALCEGKKHIPFRNSKLTQLLKDSLGGSCRTAMIANISPNNGSFGETQNTLHWANRAKEIRTKVNEGHEELDVPDTIEDRTKLLTDMQKDNQQLRLQLARLHQKFVLAQQGSLSMQDSPVTPLTPNLMAGTPIPQQFLRPSTDARVQGKTSGLHSSLSEQEFPERVTSERTIRDLQRTIQLLEMEMERAKQEILRREEKHNATISQLQQEHALELKRKDEIIQQLRQRSMNEAASSPISKSTKLLLSGSGEPKTPSGAGTVTHTISRLSLSKEPTSRNLAVETIFSAPATPPPSTKPNPGTLPNPITPGSLHKSKRPDGSPIQPISRVPFSLQTNPSTTLSIKPIPSYTKFDSKKQDLSCKPALDPVSEKGFTPKMGVRPVRYTSNKIPSLPPIRQAAKESRPRVVDPAPRRLNIPQHPPRSPPLPRFCSPSKPGTQLSRGLNCTKKRSFWDITNTTTPATAPVVRAAARRLSIAPTNTPSLLLQVLLSSERSYNAEFEDFNYC